MGSSLSATLSDFLWWRLYFYGLGNEASLRDLGTFFSLVSSLTSKSSLSSLTGSTSEPSS